MAFDCWLSFHARGPSLPPALCRHQGHNMCVGKIIMNERAEVCGKSKSVVGVERIGCPGRCFAGLLESDNSPEFSLTCWG